MTTTAAKGCGGDGCDAPHTWPLHHVRHRGALRRLCTSCVLKCHPGSFCSFCFAVLDAGPPRPPSPPPSAVVHCSKCPSVSHLSCLHSTDLASHFLCPSCRNPDGFSYFPADDAGDASIEGSLTYCEEKRKTIDLSSAKVLLAAARLAAASMSRAAAAARVEAERKVKEAMVARKRAREMLERALLISKKERERIKESNGYINKTLVPSSEFISPKKKKASKPKNSSVISMAAAQKRVQSREREKWMRFHEPIPTVHGLAQGIMEHSKSKGISVASVPGNVALDTKNSASTSPNQAKHVEQEEEKKALLFGSKNSSVKEEEAGLVVDANKGSMLPQST